jgi:hypothetical protein
MLSDAAGAAATTLASASDSVAAIFTTLAGLAMLISAVLVNRFEFKKAEQSRRLHHYSKLP